MKYLFLILIIFMLSCAKGEYISCDSNEDCKASQKMCSTLTHVCEYPKQCSACSIGKICNPSSGECETANLDKIQDIWKSEEQKILTKAVVTSIDSKGFTVQNGVEDILYNSGVRISNAIYVRTDRFEENLSLGDTVIIKGKKNIVLDNPVTIYELIEVEYEKSNSDLISLPDFTSIKINSDSKFLLGYDSMLVTHPYKKTMGAFKVTSIINDMEKDYYEYVISDENEELFTLNGDFISDFGAKEGDIFDMMSGILKYNNGKYQIFPRTVHDLGDDYSCAASTCKKWEYCSVDSTCVLKVNRCDDKHLCSDNKLCNENHYCDKEKLKPSETFLNGNFDEWDEGDIIPSHWNIFDGLIVKKETSSEEKVFLKVYRKSGVKSNKTNIEATPWIFPKDKDLKIIYTVLDNGRIRLRAAYSFLDKNGKRIGDPHYQDIYTDNSDSVKSYQYEVTSIPDDAYSILVFFRVYKDQNTEEPTEEEVKDESNSLSIYSVLIE